MQRVFSPDVHPVLNGFSRAADTYDLHAVHHRRIASILASMAGEFDPASVLELGCGTGILSRRISGLFPNAHKVFTDGAPGMVRVCRAKVPPSSLARHTIWDFHSSSCISSYDMVISSCALQWSTSPAETASRIHDLVSPGGITAHAIPVKGMLMELERSFRMAGLEWRGLRYLSGGRWDSLFRQAGFTVLRSCSRSVRVGYETAACAIRALNGIGASLSHLNGSALPGAGSLRSALRNYDSVFRDSSGRVSSTYRVHFIIARRDPS